MTAILYISGTIITLAFALAFIRLLIGPTLPDRVLALDLMASIAVAGICLYAMLTDRYIVTDAAMVLALILFLGAISFAYYLEKKGANQ